MQSASCKIKIVGGGHLNWLKEGLKYSIPLLVSVPLSTMVGYSLLFIVSSGNVKLVSNGSREIGWINYGIAESIKNLSTNLWYFFIRGLSYFPIGEFVVALLIYVLITTVLVVKNKNKDYLFVALFLLISLFSLAIIQGNRQDYLRSQSIYVFVSFVAFLVYYYINNKQIRTIYVVFMALVCLRQSVYLHELLALNNLRSENETYIIRLIGSKLYSEYDVSKTIVFCGQYDLGEHIESQISIKSDSKAAKIEMLIRKMTGHVEMPQNQEYVLANVNSCINWAMKSFQSQILMKEYLSFFGFDIKVIENVGKGMMDGLITDYTKIAQNANMNPLEIRDMGEYILVYFGPIKDNINA